MSRIPVREALRSLDADGWVEIKPRYGVYVRERSDEELGALFEVRAVAESFSARLAAERYEEADLKRLQEIVDASRVADSVDGHARLKDLGNEFFAAIWQATNNPVLESILAGLAKRAQFYWAPIEDEIGHEWVDVHEGILEAIEARRGEDAQELMRLHVEATGKAVLDLLLGR